MYEVVYGHLDRHNATRTRGTLPIRVLFVSCLGNLHDIFMPCRWQSQN